MLDETPQTPGTPEVRAARPALHRFSTAARLTMMIPRTERGGDQASHHGNKELSQEELFEARALAARYPSPFSILHPVFGLQPSGEISPSYATVPNQLPLSLA
jgi:hypothetical protein